MSQEDVTHAKMHDHTKLDACDNLRKHDSADSHSNDFLHMFCSPNGESKIANLMRGLLPALSFPSNGCWTLHRIACKIQLPFDLFCRGFCDSPEAPDRVPGRALGGAKKDSAADAWLVCLPGWSAEPNPSVSCTRVALLAMVCTGLDCFAVFCYGVHWSSSGCVAGLSTWLNLLQICRTICPSVCPSLGSKITHR